MALMKCPDCGRSVSPRAVACPECGCPAEYFEEQVECAGSSFTQDKVTIASVTTEAEKEFKTNEYAIQIRIKILEAYIHNMKYDVADFYSKAQFYGMNADDIDLVCKSAEDIIEKLNLYLDNLYIQNCGLRLNEELLKEFAVYGKSLGIKEEMSESFHKFYEKQNKIIEKRKYLEELLENYSETGTVDWDQHLYETSDSSVRSEELFDEYRNRILEMERIIEAEYPAEKPKDFTETQLEKLREIAKKYYFVNNDIVLLITGYEVRNGIYDKRLLMSKDQVLKQLDEKFSKTYTVFDNRHIKFETKYFIHQELEKIAWGAQAAFKQEIEKLDKDTSNVCKTIENLFNKYTERISEDIQRLEKVFDFSMGKQLNAEISNNIESIWNKIGDLELNLEEIAQGKIIVKSERARRKKERGKWSGYGACVTEAIKDAAVESAKNIVPGVAQFGVNIVGNVVASVATNIRKGKEIDRFLESVELNMNVISGGIVNECVELIDDYYTELRFDPECYDTIEEKNMRQEFFLSQSEKEEKAIALLLKNPYNSLNGVTVQYEYIVNHKDLWNENTENAFAMMDQHFGWKVHFQTVCEEIREKATGILKKEAEDVISDESVITDYAEIIKILESMMIAEPDEELSKLYDEDQSNYEQLLEKQKYVHLLKDIQGQSVEQILEMGGAYHQRSEFSKAQGVYVYGLKNNPTAKTIIENLYEAKTKGKMLDTLEDFVSKKSSINSQIYDEVMGVLVGIKNKEDKTIFDYASESHRIKLMGELLNYNPNLENTSVNEKKKVFCTACGGELTETANFCKYCGKKLK